MRARFSPNVSDTNPLELIWVPPEDIKYTHDNPPSRLGAVVAGDWDLDRERLAKERIIEFIDKTVCDNYSRKETELYRHSIEQLQQGVEPRGCCSEAELHELFDKIESLYHQIESSSYRSQQSITASTPKLVDKLRSSKNRDTFHPVLDEVAVNIHRDGEIAHLRSGAHRLTIAQHLDISEIPVLVRARHTEWQAIRDEVLAADNRSDLSDRALEYMDHPDLRSIRPS